MDQTPQPNRRENARNHNLQLHRNSAFVKVGSPKGHGRWKRIVGIVLTLFLSIGLGYAAHMYFSIYSAIDSSGSKNAASSAKIASRRPISVLILGVDQGIEGRHEQGNSDTLILATANPTRGMATMTSIPRDTLADIKGDGGKYSIFRVNVAYQVGGNQAAVKTVSALLNTPIDYYIEVNMKALRSLVNAVGGVRVKVPFSFSYDWNSFHKGYQHLNGRHAVAYVRMRKEDPRGDYGRQLRQRQVIEAIMHKALSVNTITNYRKLVTIFGKYVKTNMSFGDMFSLALNYRGVAQNMKSNYIQGHDAWINGSSIQVASTEELQSKSNLIRKNLALPKATLNNEETRQNSLNEKYNQIHWHDLNAFNNYQVYDHNGNPTDIND